MGVNLAALLPKWGVACNYVTEQYLAHQVSLSSRHIGSLLATADRNYMHADVLHNPPEGFRCIHVLPSMFPEGNVESLMDVRSPQFVLILRLGH